MFHRRSVLALAVLALAVCQIPSLAQAAVAVNPPVPKVPAFIQAAIDNPARADKQRVRDANRKPGETLALVGLKPGAKVIEIASFGQYYTDILSPAVGPKGHVYMYDLPYLDPRFGDPSRAFVAAHPNTSFTTGKFDEIDYPKGVDLITIVLYYHDLKPNKVDTAVFDKKLLEALKPGGKLLIVDHKAEAGSGWRDAGTIHRMGVETIVQELTAAGFKQTVDSDLLANPADDRSKLSFSPGERGHTDQALFIFEKPR
jgi:predicted methyltransferase